MKTRRKIAIMLLVLIAILSIGEKVSFANEYLERHENFVITSRQEGRTVIGEAGMMTQVQKEKAIVLNKKTYRDEALGATITETAYFIPDEKGVVPEGLVEDFNKFNDCLELTSARSSGRGTFRNEKQLEWDGGYSNPTTIYAEGYFVWGNGDVSVSNPSGGYDYVPYNATVLKSSTSDGTGQYGWVFNKFAYVTYDFSVKNVIGLVRDLSVTTRVSESGNQI